MSADATINVRMPGDLKRNGSQVLERMHISPTELVKSLYRYLDKMQEVPPCLDIAQVEEESVYDKRRRMLRKVTGTLSVPEGYDFEADRKTRIEAKYGDLL